MIWKPKLKTEQAQSPNYGRNPTNKGEQMKKQIACGLITGNCSLLSLLCVGFTTLIKSENGRNE